MQLELSKIRRDGGTQPRTTVDLYRVKEYAEEMQDGATFPPVTVFYDGTNYWLADGFHRVEATMFNSGNTIEVDILQGTLADAQWYSYGVNRTHGFRRSDGDKRQAVIAALRHPYHAGKSDQQIADHCGVSRPYVNKISNSLVTDDKSNRPTSRAGKDGRTTNTSNIGKGKKPKTPPPVQQQDDDEPLSPYEQQIAEQYEAAQPAIAEPPRVPESELIEEANRLVNRYCYADMCRLYELIGQSIGILA